MGTKTARIARRVDQFFEGDLGFALYIGWFYCAFFTPTFLPMGGGSSLPLVFGASWGASSAVVALCFLVAARKRPNIARIGFVRFAAVALAAGTLVVYLTARSGATPLFVIASCFCGAGTGIFIPVWAQALYQIHAERAKEAICLSFFVGFLLGVCVQLIGRFLPVVVLAALLPMISLSCLQEKAIGFGVKKELSEVAFPEASDGDSSRGFCVGRLGKFLLLYGFLWFALSFTRCALLRQFHLGSISSTVLFSAITVAIAVCLAAYAKAVQHRGKTQAFSCRLAAPLLVFAYSFSCLEDIVPWAVVVAVALLMVCEFAVHLWFFMDAIQLVASEALAVREVFSSFIVAQGVAIFLSYVAFLLAGALLGEDKVVAILPLVVAVVIFSVFFQWPYLSSLFHEAPSSSPRSKETAVAASDLAEKGPAAAPCAALCFDDLVHRQAQGLHERFGLSDRELEILELLLAGRNRPYISEELTISVNTVNAHVKRVFSKCGVHSQQELLDLARNVE